MVGVLLRRFRVASAMSQEALSEASGVSVRTISDLERGQRASAHPETARLLATALGLSDDDRRELLEAARPELREEEGDASPEPESSPWKQSLPVPPTPLVGRESVLAAMVSLLEHEPARVITLTGTGGVGKTRVAIELARMTLPIFDDGVVFVSLATVSDPALVASAIGQALGIELTNTSLLERIATLLQNRRVLLVLDNFEHLVDAAPVISTLMAAAPGLSVLVTSRVRLRLSAELEYPVPTLDLPAPDVSIDDLHANEELRLFADRARAVDPGFTLTEQNAGVVADICRRLGGLPLAIELVASRLKILPVGALLTRLEQQLPLLAGGSRDMPQRQQSMGNSIAWSYNLLDPSEQQLLRWMSVFVGGFSLEAAEAAGIAIELNHVLTFEIVLSLVDNALVQSVSGPDSSPRFRMLETIRAFGLEQLGKHDELENARFFHAQHFLAFAASDAPLPCEICKDSWIRRLDVEHDNLVAAFDALCQPGTANMCHQFVAALGPYLYARGPVQEGWKRIRRAVEVTPFEPSRLKTHVLFWAVHMAMAANEFTEATALAHECISVANMAGDLADQAAATHILAWLEEVQEHWDAAADLLDQQITRWQALENPFMEGVALMLSGGIAYAQGDLELARLRETKALVIFGAFPDPGCMASTEWYLGCFAVAEGNHAEAAGYYERSLQSWLGNTEAFRHFKSLVGLADVAASIGLCESAARLFGGCDRLLDTSGTRLFPFDVPGYERAKRAGIDALGEPAFLALKVEGRRMTQEDWLIEACLIVGTAQRTPVNANA
ncbi:helix-turn-helix domain-containing protein [soil metagenome]